MSTNKIQNSALTSRTTGISAASINSAAGSLGSEIDLSASGARDTNLILELTCTLAATIAAGEPWYVWVIPDPAGDGSTYEVAAAALLARSPDAIFRCIASASAQNVAYGTGRPDQQILVPPCKFKLLLWNGTTKNGTTVTLRAYSFTLDIQAAA